MTITIEEGEKKESDFFSSVYLGNRDIKEKKKKKLKTVISNNNNS